MKKQTLSRNNGGSLSFLRISSSIAEKSAADQEGKIIYNLRQTLLVTGSSTGIGECIYKNTGTRGCTRYLCMDRMKSRQTKSLREIVMQYQAFAVTGDLATEVPSQVADKGGSLAAMDILINNAEYLRQ